VKKKKKKKNCATFKNKIEVEDGDNDDKGMMVT